MWAPKNVLINKCSPIINMRGLCSIDAGKSDDSIRARRHLQPLLQNTVYVMPTAI